MIKKTISVIIVAGGSGSRMGGQIPKQFLPINKRPILMRTIDKFASFGKVEEIVLVLAKDYLNFWDDLCKEYDFTITHKVVAGGIDRTSSVRNGLKALESSDGVVLIHDAVRPFVTHQTIDRVWQAAHQHKAAVAAVKVLDSMRVVDKNGTNSIIDRESLRAIQTPQGFDINTLKKAYDSSLKQYSDDASLIESMGIEVQIVDGDYNNIKITTPIDMAVAEVILKDKNEIND